MTEEPGSNTPLGHADSDERSHADGADGHRPFVSESTGKNNLFYYLAALMVVVLLGVAAWASGFFSSSEESEEDDAAVFQMVGILPLTGDAASYGIPIRQAAELAQKEINADGGIDGRPIRIEWRDGKCAEEDARVAAQTLLNQYDPRVMIAGACSSEFLAAAPLAQDDGILAISSSATSPEISSLGSFVFRTSPSDALAGVVAAEYAYNSLEARRAAILTEDKAYTLGLRDVFSEEFAALGGEVVINEVYQTGTSDFDAFAAEVAAADVDLVYVLPQSPTPGIVAIDALKEAGVTAEFLTAEVLLIRDAIVEQGEVLEGVTGIEVLFDESRPAAEAMLTAFAAEYNLEATYPGFMAGMYDMLYLLKDAYEQTDGSTSAVAEYLYNVVYDGAVGTLRFDRRGDPQATYSVRTISDREAPIVDVIEPSQ